MLQLFEANCVQYTDEVASKQLELKRVWECFSKSTLYSKISLGNYDYKSFVSSTKLMDNLLKAAQVFE